jgi:hypothetical protein
MLTRMLGTPAQQSSLPAEFGMPLQSAILDAYLIRQRTAVQEYLNTHMEEWQEIQTVVQEEIGDVRARPCGD